MPLSGSLVTQSVAVRYGAESKPGVDMGTGRLASPPPSAANLRAGLHDFLTRCILDEDGRDRIRHGFHPQLTDLIDRHAKTGGVDFRRGGKSADQHRNVVCFAESTDDIRKKERPPFILAQAALKLPPHKRMKFRILVDAPVDADEQSAVG